MRSARVITLDPPYLIEKLFHLTRKTLICFQLESTAPRFTRRHEDLLVYLAQDETPTTGKLYTYYPYDFPVKNRAFEFNCEFVRECRLPQLFLCIYHAC